MLKLDIGCGGRGSRQQGFIGIDTWPRPDGKTQDEYVQANFIHDPLPWEDNTVDEAIALHIIEHLMPEDGERLIRRAVDLLKPVCTLTVTCPDLRLLAIAYVNRDSEFFKARHLRTNKEIWPGPTDADRFNWAIHQEGHRWSYDVESLAALAWRATLRIDKIDPMPIGVGHRWETRPGHETGIIITKAF